MKTIDEILNRSDYKRMSEQLESRCNEIAKKLRIKMYQLDLSEIGDYEVRFFRNSNGTYRFLAYEGSSLEDVNNSYYYCGDFNCRVVGASHRVALRFLNNAKNLFEHLDKIEDEQTKEVSDALEKCSSY